jgi:hypothetical protein
MKVEPNTHLRHSQSKASSWSKPSPGCLLGDTRHLSRRAQAPHAVL